MTKLKELLDSLMAVMVRYHDSQTGGKKFVESDPIQLSKKSRACAINILQGKEGDFQTRLKVLIKESTGEYPLRKPFLDFLLHQIVFLKTLQDRTKSFDPIQFVQYRNQLASFLIDLRVLLNTSKSNTHKVTYSNLHCDNEPTNEVTISVSGLVNNYYPYSLCNSGFLLKEEVFDTFHLTINHSETDIKAIVESLCVEHQNSLLVPELQEHLAEVKKNSAVEHETVLLVPDLKAQLLKQKEKFEELDKQIAEQDAKLQAALNSVKGHEDTISALRTQINGLNYPSPFIAGAFQPAFFAGPRFGFPMRGTAAATTNSSATSAPPAPTANNK